MFSFFFLFFPGEEICPLSGEIVFLANMFRAHPFSNLQYLLASLLGHTFAHCLARSVKYGSQTSIKICKIKLFFSHLWRKKKHACELRYTTIPLDLYKLFYTYV